MANFSLSITRIFEATPDEVFAAFAEAAEWWTPPGCSVASAAVDFRVGGAFRIGMCETATGRTSFVRGEFKDLKRPSRLVFSHIFETDPPCGTNLARYETLVTVDLIDLGGSTEMHFVQKPLPSRAAQESTGVGFAGILENLSQYLRATGESRAQERQSAQHHALRI